MRRTTILVTTCLLVGLSACAPSFTAQGPAPVLNKMVADNPRMVSIVVTADSIEMIAADADNATTTRLFSVPDWELDRIITTEAATNQPSMASAHVDVDDLLARVDDLAARCDHTWEARLLAASETAATTIVTCGDDSHWFIDDIELAPVTNPWSSAGFRKLWAEMEALSPSGEVEVIRVTSRELAVVLPAAGGNGPIIWQRGLDSVGALTTVSHPSDESMSFPLADVDATTAWTTVSAMATREGINLDDDAVITIRVENDNPTIELGSPSGQASTTVEISG